MDQSKKARILKTPVYKIPIGEAIINQDGHYSLRIKKPKSEEVEEIPLDRLLSMVVTEAENKKE